MENNSHIIIKQADLRFDHLPDQRTQVVYIRKGNFVGGYRRYSSILISLSLVIGFGIYIWFRRERILPLLSVSPIYLAIVIILGCIFTAFSGLITRYLVGVFGIQLPIKEWFGLAILTTMTNCLIPFQSGSSIRAVYLKRKYELPYSKFLSTIMGIYILTFWTASIWGIGLSIAIHYIYGMLRIEIVLFLVAANILMSAFLLLSPTIPQRKNRLLRFLKNTLDGWNEIRGRKRLIIILVLLLIGGYIVKGLQLFSTYKALGLNVKFLAIFLLSILLFFSVLINITPANLGIQEAIISFFSAGFGMGFSEGLIVALLLRLVTMVIAFSLGPIFSFLLIKERR